MTKKLITAGTIALVTLALAVTLYILNSNPVEEEELPPYGSTIEVFYVIGQAEAKKVQSVAVSNDSGNFTVNVGNADSEKSSDLFYSIEGLENRPEDRTAFSTIVNNSAKIIASSLVSENEQNLSVFGLDSPEVTARIKYTDGSTDELHLGSAAPGGAGIYAKSIKNDDVYLVSASNVEKFYYSPYDFFSKTITEGDPEGSDINTATLSGAVRPEPIVIRPAVTETGGVFVLATHNIVQPVQVSVDLDKGMKALRTSLAMTASRVVDAAATDEKKGLYGLLNPYSVISLETKPDENGDKIEYTVSASEPDQNGMIYLMTSHSDLVYTMSADGLTWLDAQVFDLMGKLVVLPNINTVGALTIETPNSSVTFLLEGDDDNLKVTAEGKTLDNDSFRKFYQSVLAARYDSIPDEDMPQNAPFVMSFTYEYRDGGKPDVVTFRQGAARKLYVDLNGGSAFYMPSSYADKILEDIPKLIAGQPVTTYL